MRQSGGGARQRFSVQNLAVLKSYDIFATLSSDGLSYGVMVTQQILVLSFWVRVPIAQPSSPAGVSGRAFLSEAPKSLTHSASTRSVKRLPTFLCSQHHPTLRYVPQRFQKYLFHKNDKKQANYTTFPPPPYGHTDHMMLQSA